MLRPVAEFADVLWVLRDKDVSKKPRTQLVPRQAYGGMRLILGTARPS